MPSSAMTLPFWILHYVATINDRWMQEAYIISHETVPLKLVNSPIHISSQSDEVLFIRHVFNFKSLAAKLSTWTPNVHMVFAYHFPLTKIYIYIYIYIIFFIFNKKFLKILYKSISLEHSLIFLSLSQIQVGWMSSVEPNSITPSTTRIQDMVWSPYLLPKRAR